MQNRVVMLVDFDYFFAQCEELRNPTIKTNRLSSAFILGAQRKAAQLAPATTLPENTALNQACPSSLLSGSLRDTDAVFLPVDHEYYERNKQQDNADSSQLRKQPGASQR